MLDIPSTLLDKIEQKYQTIDNNADPKMDIIAQRAAKFINQGTYLAPNTVRTGNSLGRLDTCVRREDKNLEPSEIIMLYIENGLAKVATLPYVHSPDDLFEYQYTVGPATDVSCDFDGRWAHITDRTGIYFDTSILWALVTFGEPYLAVVNEGVLTVQQGELGEPFTLCDANVTRVSILRGLKSVTDILTDQGIVCAYVKTDGKVYYRSYCEQENGTYIWENEHEVTEITPTVTDLGLFRTGDYRLGFIYEKAGIMSWLITNRSWSGMATPPEYLSALNKMTVAVSEIDYIDTRSDNDHILVSAGMTVATLWGVDQTILIAENINDGSDNYGYKVRLTWDYLLGNVATQTAAFTLTDSAAHTFTETAISQISEKVIEVTFKNFNNAVGNCTVAYTPGTMTGEAGQSLGAASKVFTPTELVPFEVIPPVPTGSENIIDWGYPL